MLSAVFAHPFDMTYEKVCVEIAAKFLRDGGVRPTAVVWSDGRRYAVERVRAIAPKPAHVGSVLPVRFTCLIGGKEKYLWFEPDRMRWFVEVMRP